MRGGLLRESLSTVTTPDLIFDKTQPHACHTVRHAELILIVVILGHRYTALAHLFIIVIA